MATSKITEKPLVTDLKDDASFYIAQTETVNDEEVTALRRIARDDFEDEIGLTDVKSALQKCVKVDDDGYFYVDEEDE